MIGYHVTTPRKFERYVSTGGILPPVRFWPTLETAQRWSKRTSRPLILKIECNQSYPLPDHKPARWTPEIIREYKLNDITNITASRFTEEKNLGIINQTKEKKRC